MLYSNPYVDRFWVLEDNLLVLLKQLKNEHFDLVIDLHKNLRSLLFKFFLGIKFLSYDKLNLSKWLMTSFKINKLPSIHLVDRYFNALTTLGIKNDGKGLDFFIKKNDIPFFKRYQMSTKFIVGVLGAAHYTKTIPLSKWRELIPKLNYTIILIGGKKEMQAGSILENEFPNLVFSYAGKLDIQESAEWMQYADFVVTPDTGMMHIAAALDKPMITLWGNTIPHFGMFPYFKNGSNKELRMEVVGLDCRPCSKIGFQECPKKHFRCMHDQHLNSALVVDFINKLVI